MSNEKVDKTGKNLIGWFALIISLFSLCISGSQYVRVQRPKIAIHPDSRLISKKMINEVTEEYSFGFIFENKGNTE